MGIIGLSIATGLLYGTVREVFAMPVRLKKFIGMLLLVLLVIVYAIVSTAVAVAQLADKSAVVHLAYYFVTGLLWILPAMLIIKWMEGKPREKSQP
jgi:hypothetical protein